MKIGLFGYGKMGATIEKLAVRDGHHIVWRINRENRASFTPEKLREADVAIEFSRPEAALANIRACLDVGLPVVSGTTGWLADMSVARQVCEEKNGAFFWASNFSVGVNLFFLLNQKLADLMFDDLEQRSKAYFDNDLLIAACRLDHRYKSLTFIR